MTGSIRCTKCDSGFDPEKGVCSKCGRIKCYLHLYFKGKHYKFRKDKDNRPLGYMQALEQLIALNRAVKEKAFNPADWLAPNVKARKFENVIMLWMQQKESELTAGELSPGTIKDYKGYVKHYFTPILGKYDIKEIRYERLNAFRNQLKKDLKLKTRRNILNALHGVFNWFWRQGIISDVPPFPSIEGNDATARKALTYEEQQEGLGKIPEMHRSIFDFGFETGLRPGELCAFKILDIKAGTKEALIQRTLSEGTERETTKGKTKQYIALSDHAWEIVQQNIKGRDLQDYLFVNPDTGRRYTTKALNLLWRQHSGIDCCHYEAGRHSFCTQLAEIEINPMMLQSLMRHSDIRTTKGYCHPRAEKQRDLVNRRGKLLPFPSRQENNG